MASPPAPPPPPPTLATPVAVSRMVEMAVPLARDLVSARSMGVAMVEANHATIIAAVQALVAVMRFDLLICFFQNIWPIEMPALLD